MVKYVIVKNSQGICSIEYDGIEEKIYVNVNNENIKKFITNSKDRLAFFSVVKNLKSNYEIDNKLRDEKMNTEETVSYIRKHTREFMEKYNLYENINYNYKKKHGRKKL